MWLLIGERTIGAVTIRGRIMLTDIATRPAVDRRLAARTPEGVGFVAVCEELAGAFAPRAAGHDRDGTFPFENWEELRASGALRACIPAQLGGLGVSSIHDVAVGIGRLAYGDASTAIGANMHLTHAWAYTKRWLEAQATGDAEAEQRAAATLSVFASAVFAGPNTEPGNNVGVLPTTTAKPVDGGYVINGIKSFGTNTPVADIFGFWVTILDTDGSPRTMGTAVVPKGTPGMVNNDDWDALGMRASGSCSASFTDCFVPAAMVNETTPLGTWTPEFMLSVLAVTFPLIGAFVGIAEAALDLALSVVTTKRRQPSGVILADRRGVRQLIAEAEVELAAARASLARAAILIDDYYDTHHPSEADTADLRELMAEAQCANLVVKRGAVAVVDRAMNAVGGGAYLNTSPLARHWRDVRAGSFMQPFTPVEAHGYIGAVSLGREPDLDE